MKESDFILTKELINTKIKKIYFISQTEYSKNPIYQENHLIWKYLQNPQSLSYGIN